MKGWSSQFKRETFTRMAENIEHAVKVHRALYAQPDDVRINLLIAAEAIRVALESWPAAS